MCTGIILLFTFFTQLFANYSDCTHLLAALLDSHIDGDDDDDDDQQYHIRNQICT
jgi:hypothetical protein